MEPKGIRVCRLYCPYGKGVSGMEFPSFAWPFDISTYFLVIDYSCKKVLLKQLLRACLSGQSLGELCLLLSLLLKLQYSSLFILAALSILLRRELNFTLDEQTARPKMKGKYLGNNSFCLF